MTAARPPGVELSAAVEIERLCLERVRRLLAEGAALRNEMELVAHRSLVEVEADARRPWVIVITSEHQQDGLRERHERSIWEANLGAPTAVNEAEINQVALLIAVGAAEP